jgi:uncharacterized protein
MGEADMSEKPPEKKQVFESKDGQTKSEKTTDGFQNFAAKLGVGGFGRAGFGGENNLLSRGHYDFNLVTRERVQLEAAYRGSWIVGQVIDSVAEDMTRAGIDITTNDDAGEVADFENHLSRLQLWQSLTNTIRWARLFGGAIAVMQIEGQDLATPLDPRTVGLGQFKGLVVYDRWQIWPVLSKLINSGPNIGLPSYYDVVLGSNLNDPGQLPGGQETDRSNHQIRVHHSRCVRMEGLHLPFWQAITEMMWGESVLERMWDRLIAFDTASLATGGLINRANLRMVGVKGLREILAAGGEAQQALVQQFEYIREFQSNEGLTLLDSEDEYAANSYSFAGLADVLIQFGQQVSGSAQIPLVRLFGQSPTGLNSNGDADIRQYYDSILQKQEATLREPLETVLKVAWQSFTGMPTPEDFSFEFTPLWQMSALDKATIAKTNTDTILEAQQAGIIDTATAMRELKQASGDHGLFTHITDEQIEEAESMAELPTPEQLGINVQTTGDPGEGPAKPHEQIASHFEGGQEDPEQAFKPGAKSDDSAWKQIRRWFSGDSNFKESDHPRAKSGQFGSGGGKEQAPHTESYQGHELTVKGGKLFINGEEQEGNFPGYTTAIQRGKVLVAKKKKGKDAAVNDPGVPGTMKEFYKGTLKSSSGKKVTSKKQALAIGYSEEGEGKDTMADCYDDRAFIRDWLKAGGRSEE